MEVTSVTLSIRTVSFAVPLLLNSDEPQSLVFIHRTSTRTGRDARARDICGMHGCGVVSGAVSRGRDGDVPQDQVRKSNEQRMLPRRHNCCMRDIVYYGWS